MELLQHYKYFDKLGSKLGVRVALVYGAVSAKAEGLRTGYCTASTVTIGKELGISALTVKQALKVLLQEGLIERNDAMRNPNFTVSYRPVRGYLEEYLGTPKPEYTRFFLAIAETLGVNEALIFGKVLSKCESGGACTTPLSEIAKSLGISYSTAKRAMGHLVGSGFMFKDGMERTLQTYTVNLVLVQSYFGRGTTLEKRPRNVHEEEVSPGYRLVLQRMKYNEELFS